MHSSEADSALVPNSAPARTPQVPAKEQVMKTSARTPSRSNNERLGPQYDIPLPSDEDNYDPTTNPRTSRSFTGGSLDCAKCGSTFWNEESFRTHGCDYQQDQGNPKSHRCSLCQSMYREGANEHERQILNQQIFYCRQCPSICRGKASLEVHCRQEHDNTGSFSCCDRCVQHFLQPSSQLGFRSSHTSGLSRPLPTAGVPCMFCGAAFENTGSLEAHMQTHHPGSSSLTSYSTPPHPSASALPVGSTVDKHEALGNANQALFFSGGQERHPQEIFGRNEPPRQRHFPGSHGQTGMTDATAVFPSSMHGSTAIPGMFASLSKPDGVIPLNRVDPQFGVLRHQYTNGLTKGDTIESGGRSGFLDGSISGIPQARPYQIFDDGTHAHLSRSSGLMLSGYVAGVKDTNGLISSRTLPSAAGFSSLCDTVLTCRTCGLRFQSPTTFEQHECRGCVIRKEGKGTISCDQCHAELKNEQNLKRHISVVHGTKQPYGCPQCSASFSSRGSLKIHQQSVHGLQDGSCFPGSSASRRKSGAAKKIEKTYSCPLCPDTFKWKGNLKRHRQLVHEKIKPFTCNICKAKFGTKSNMRVHLITHEKIH